ncbi:hypothetical protein FRB95_008741 [Tulasnella sp. JGI-2019a]|nr:hypothetical protein FRB95_008741 [Tulasnella sp. JGI-2019a]
MSMSWLLSFPVNITMAWSLVNRLFLQSRSKRSRRLTTSNALPLPVELLLMTIKHLNSREMLSALRTCRGMRSIVETCLYAHISIPFYHPRRMSKLLRTLHDRPDLAQNVITFNGSFYPALLKSRGPRVITPTSLIQHWYQQWSVERHERAFSTTSATSINNMMNVKSLTLHDFHWLGTPSQNLICDAICSTVSLASVTTLILQGYDFFQHKRHAGSECQLSLILRHQPLLERLELRSGNWDLEQWILPTDVPHLTYLKSGLKEAKVLVPGRPITFLAFRKMSAMPDVDVWQALTASTEPIRTLKVDIPEVNFFSSFLNIISVHLQDVQNLVLTGPGYDSLPMIIENFPPFRSLRTLHIKLWDHVDNRIENISATLYENRRANFITHLRLESPQFESLIYSDCSCNILH